MCTGLGVGGECCKCLQAVKEDNANVVASLLGRVSISQAVVQVLLQGPLSQGKALPCTARPLQH